MDNSFLLPLASKKRLATLKTGLNILRKKRLAENSLAMTAGRTINTVSQHWGTPLRYVKAVGEALGGSIELDPCSNDYSLVKAANEYSLPETDGLKASWNFKTIFVNPPYGRDQERGTSIKQWLARCSAAHEDHGAEVIALVPVATNTAHWKKHVFVKASAVCFLYDTRLRFLVDGRDEGKGAPMSCAMIYWGPSYQRFFDVFLKYGAVLDLRNLAGRQVGASEHSSGDGEE